MRILGIDPGLTRTGFGIIDINDDSLKLIDYGIVKPKNTDKLERRLLTIFNDISEIITKYNPTVVSIEEVFYGKNVKSAMRLGHAIGEGYARSTMDAEEQGSEAEVGDWAVPECTAPDAEEQGSEAEGVVCAANNGE